MKANKSILKSLTIGKEYKVLRTEHSQIVILDDQGQEMGYSLEHFNEKSFNRSDSYYYPFFKFMHENHGLILLDSELQEIVNEVQKMFKDVE